MILLQRFSTFGLFFTVFLLLLQTGQAAPIQHDSRLQVTLMFEDGSTPDLREQAKLAWPILLQRVLTQEALAHVPKSIKPFSLLLKSKPIAGGSELSFHAARLWRTFDRLNIDYIPTPPAFYVNLQLSNQAGKNMPQSAAQLMAFMQEQQQGLGVRLYQTPMRDVPMLAISLRWLTASSLQMRVYGQSKMPESSTTHHVAGDPILAMQKLLLRTLIQARDAYMIQRVIVQPQDAYTQAILTNSPEAIWIEVHGQRDLSEQLQWEKMLRNDPRVASLQPAILSRDVQNYRLQLKQKDASWLPAWFTARHFSALQTEQGWLISK